MKKLLNDFGINSDMEYFEMIVYNFKTGYQNRAIKWFKLMPKMYKALFLKSATVGNWDSKLSNENLSVLFDNI